MALEIARAHPVCRRLMTVPGVRTVIGRTFLAAIDDPARFAKSCSVGAILGMVQRKRQARRPSPRYCAVEALNQSAVAIVHRSEHGIGEESNTPD